MNALNIFEYKGTKITFEKNGKVMVNVTEFAKAFPEKNLTHIVQGNEIQEYIETLSKLQNCSLADLLRVERGGNNPGTWANSKIALRIAQKLSPEFAVWVDVKVEELLTTGKTSVETLSKMQILKMALESEQERERLQQLSESQSKEIAIMTPKALFADAVKSSLNSILVAELAKLLKQKGIEIGEKRLFQWLREKGYLCTKGAYRNQPSQKSMELGLFEVTEHAVLDRKNDNSFTAYTTKVTGKGQIYFVNKFLIAQS